MRIKSKDAHREASANFAGNDGCYEGDSKANSKAPARCLRYKIKAESKAPIRRLALPGKARPNHGARYRIEGNGVQVKAKRGSTTTEAEAKATAP